MKIRILDNSIRLRLSQSEVSEFHEKGKVEASSKFGAQPNQVLFYSLEKTSDDFLSATYGDGHIRVLVPDDMGLKWATTDEVGMENFQQLDEKHSLRILVEKDFKCLTERTGEDESDNFPNPNQVC